MDSEKALLEFIDNPKQALGESVYNAVLRAMDNYGKHQVKEAITAIESLQTVISEMKSGVQGQESEWHESERLAEDILNTLQ